jgi:hypothetical protein
MASDILECLSTIERLFSFYLQVNHIIQLFGAKELQSFVANLPRIYDYAYETKDDRFCCYLTYDIILHLKFDKN